MRNYFPEKKGFTLIEMIMSLLIISLIAGLSAPLLNAAADFLSFQTRAVILEESGIYAVSRMSREIRRLRDDESVASAGRNSYEFIDRDNRRIRYYLSGNTIRRTEGGVDKLFMDQILPDGLVFFYYNEDTADTADITETASANPVAGLGIKTDIRYLKIGIRSQNGPHTFSILEAVRLRNIRNPESDLFL